MNYIKRSGTSLLKNKWYSATNSRNGLTSFLGYGSSRGVADVGVAEFSSMPLKRTIATRNFSKTAFREVTGCSFLFQEPRSRSVSAFCSPYQLAKTNGLNSEAHCFTRSFASRASESSKEKQAKNRKEVSNIEDPFDAPTYNIPEKPVTFTEGASYSVLILIGLGLAAAAAYAVFKELIFEPKEYKIFGKALDRIQKDGQVKVRIGSPITGYGSESRNRAARQRIPNKVWTDEDGVEHVEVNFYIRGPHGGGKVYSEMFKDAVDKQWKFMYLIVEIKSPSPAQLMLESYVPA